MDPHKRRDRRSKRIWHSFKHALDGISFVLKTQPNMQIHFGIAIVMILLALLLDIPAQHILWVVFAIMFVLCLETLNTAIERTVDLMTMEFHPLAKLAKDVSAGAVLFAAVFAVFVAVYVFTEPFLIYIGHPTTAPIHILVLLFLLCFVVSLLFKNPARILLFLVLSISLCTYLFFTLV